MPPGNRFSRITRRRFLQTTAATTAGVACSRIGFSEVGASVGAAGAQPPPNVLVIQLDQLRGSVMGCAGDAMAITPHLDRLAAEGIRFSMAFASNPVCTPCRGSIQTGMYPHAHGLMINDRRLDGRWTCLADVFAAAGYATGYCGKWHLDGGPVAWNPGGYVPPERRRGWQEWEGYEKGHAYKTVWRMLPDGSRERVPGYDWEPAFHTDTAMSFIRKHAAARKPWIYYISYGPPHEPEECLQRFLDMYPAGDLVLPDHLPDKDLPRIPGRGVSEGRMRTLRDLYRMYYAQVTAVDEEVGRLLAFLADQNLDSQTMILFTSDHGDMLGEHRVFRGKCLPYRASSGIPMLARWPGNIPAGRVCDAPVSAVDIAPTLIAMTGGKAPDSMQGTSLADWCLAGAGSRPDGQYIESEYWGNWRAACDGRFLYCPGFDMLYDLAGDPHEQDNLWMRDAGQMRRMNDLLIHLAERTQDPRRDLLKAFSPG